MHSGLGFWNRLALLMILLILVLMVTAAVIGRTLPRLNIAFVSARETTSQLYLMDTGRGLDHKLSDQPVIACCPVWSPDGARLAFPALDDKTTKIFVMDWDGANARRLTPFPASDTFAAWQP